MVLPDGGRRVIPAAWTDVQSALEPAGSGALGSLDDLLAARRIVDGLLRAVVGEEGER